MRLRANRYDTFFAVDAVEAISAARKHEPDLIILDLGLPAGDGLLVMERLKAVFSLAIIPIIVVFARELHANRMRAVHAGAQALLQKPVDDAELLALIRRALGERSEREELYSPA